MKKVTLVINAELMAVMGLTDSADEAAFGTAIKQLAEKAQKVDTVQAKLDTANKRVTDLETEIEAVKATGTKAEITALMDVAVNEGKMDVPMRAQLEKDYANNPDGLKKLVATMKPYQSVTGQIENLQAKAGDAKRFEGKSWDELMTGNLLDEMRAHHPELYKAVYKKEFNEEPK